MSGEQAGPQCPLAPATPGSPVMLLEEHSMPSPHTFTLSYLASQGDHADPAVLPRPHQADPAVRQVPADPADLPFPLLASPGLPGHLGHPSVPMIRRILATRATRETLGVRSLLEYQGPLNIDVDIKLFSVRLIWSQTNEHNQIRDTSCYVISPASFSSVRPTCWHDTQILQQL